MANVIEKEVEVSVERQAQLDPSYYEDVFAFRKAVAENSVDVSRACRNMAEYKWSIKGAA